MQINWFPNAGVDAHVFKLISLWLPFAIRICCTDLDIRFRERSESNMTRHRQEYLWPPRADLQFFFFSEKVPHDRLEINIVSDS
jgi:hypothetical protein